MKKNNGLTLIELLVALVLSSILIAALYRTFIGQHKTYAVQEQVVDMQQNVRVAINRMMREIRMAGFGSVSDVLDLPDLGNGRGVNGFSEVVTAEGTNKITVVGGFRQIRQDNGDPILVASASGYTITLNYQPKEDEFNTAAKRYISIGGVESNTVKSISGTVLTLDNTLKQYHPAGTPIFKIQAITYDINLVTLVLRRNENTGGGPQPIADNIENIQFEYFDANGNPTITPSDIRMVRVTVTAKTSMSDPDFKGGDGYRRRVIASNIQVRNPLN